MGKQTDIGPWLSYFEMLDIYVQDGYLELLPVSHEAFITKAALWALTDGYRLTRPNSYPLIQMDRIVRNIRTYTEYLDVNAEAFKAYSELAEKADHQPSDDAAVFQAAHRLLKAYKAKRHTFALHVVTDDLPHELLFTILLTRRRRWWWPWRMADVYDVINYR